MGKTPIPKKNDKGPGITKVLRVKQSKFVYVFVNGEDHNDMIEFLRTA